MFPTLTIDELGQRGFRAWASEFICRELSLGPIGIFSYLPRGPEINATVQMQHQQYCSSVHRVGLNI